MHRNYETKHFFFHGQHGWRYSLQVGTVSDDGNGVAQTWLSQRSRLGKHRALSIRPKIPEFPGGGANGKEIFRNLISEFLVYLARLSQYSGKSE